MQVFNFEAVTFKYTINVLREWKLLIIFMKVLYILLTKNILGHNPPVMVTEERLDP